MSLLYLLFLQISKSKFHLRVDFSFSKFFIYFHYATISWHIRWDSSIFRDYFQSLEWRWDRCEWLYSRSYLLSSRDPCRVLRASRPSLNTRNPSHREYRLMTPDIDLPTSYPDDHSWSSYIPHRTPITEGGKSISEMMGTCRVCHLRWLGNISRHIFTDSIRPPRIW